MAWDYLKEDQRIGGVKILECQLPTQSKDSTVYRVACRTCGAVSEMRHRQIMDRVTKGRESCNVCKNTTAAAIDSAPDGVRDLRGGFWPKLKGPMGPRWGFGYGTNQVIGQGASGAEI